MDDCVTLGHEEEDEDSGDSPPPSVGGPSSEAGSSDDNDSDDDDSPDARGSKKRKQNSDADGGPAKPEEPSGPDRSSPEAGQMREYLHAALAPSTFFSVWTPSVHDVPGELRIFQLIEKEAQHKQVELFEKTVEKAPGLYVVTVQEFNIWGPRGGKNEPDALDVFILKDPMRVDICSLIGLLPAYRDHVKIWTPSSGPWAVSGCVHLGSPQPMKVDMPSGSKKMPLLCLLDALHNLGFIGVEQQVRHTPKGTTYDCRRRSLHKSYIRCILARSALWDRGVAEFPSGELVKFYELLLRSPSPSKVEPGKGDKHYANLLENAHESYGVQIEVCFETVDHAPRFPRSDADSMGGESSKSDVSEESSSSSSSTSSKHKPPSMDGDSDEDALAPEDRYPKILFGEPVRRKWLKKAGEKPSLSLEVSCPNQAHRVDGGCTCSRRVNLDVAVFGPDASVYCLGTWLLGAFERPKHQHHKWRPSRLDVREHKETYYGGD